MRRLWSTDHKTVGVQYLFAAAIFLLLGFGIVLIMRWQLAYPGSPIPLLGRFFSEDHPWMPGGALVSDFYNQLGGMHGTIMIFLGVVPILVGGFGSYFVPLMLGATNFAFPKLSRIGFWFFIAGGAVILGSFFAQNGPAGAGWTAYPPLATIDLGAQSQWLIGIALVYVSSLFLAINIIVTIVQLRCPGMTFGRMPFFIWSQFVTAFLLLLAFPPLVAAAMLQLMDRLRGTSFFLPSGLVVSGEPLDLSGGGSALLYQHLFWFLGHPEVYVILLPALGMVAEIYAANTRKPLWGHSVMVKAACFLGVMSMLVWAHHMYLTGMGTAVSAFFEATTLIISIPSVLIGTSLLMSLWGGSIRFTTPMLFALGFLPMFAMGGLTGMPLALASTNIPLHDTYYIIGHFHYIVAPGVLMAIFAGFYHWFPKMTGKVLNHKLGVIHFVGTFLFMNATFMPMLLQGFAGVNRRLYDGGATYAHGTEFFFLNKAATHSAMMMGVVQIFFIANLVWTLWRGRKVDSNPWEATTMEWATSSPPLPYVNFETPMVAHRGPHAYSEPGHATDFTPQHIAEGES